MQRHFPEVVRALSSLRALRIGWAKRSDQSTVYASALPGLMHRTTEVAHNLVELRLTSFRISLLELTATLRCLGSRLLVFETCLSYQEEEQFGRLEALLHVTGKHNPGLREFNVAVEAVIVETYPDDEVKRRGQKMLTALRRMQQHARELAANGPLTRWTRVVYPKSTMALSQTTWSSRFQCCKRRWTANPLPSGARVRISRSRALQS